MRINFNTLLIILGSLGILAPDITGLAAWLSAMHVGWLTHVVHGLGLLAAFCSAAPLVVPRLRAFLALLGLATPPGAVAPWDPTRDAGPGPTPRATTTNNVVALPGTPTPPAGTRPGTGYGNKVGAVLVLVLGSLLLGSTAWAQSSQPSPQLGGCFDDGLFCAGLAVEATVTKIGLSSGNKGISGGWATGAGYGLTIAPDQWYASGIDVFMLVNSASNQLSTLPAAANSKVSPMVMLHLLNYLFVGLGADVVAPNDPTGSYSTDWYLTFGFGSTVNSVTRAYARAQAVRMGAPNAGAGR